MKARGKINLKFHLNTYLLKKNSLFLNLFSHFYIILADSYSFYRLLEIWKIKIFKKYVQHSFFTQLLIVNCRIKRSDLWLSMFTEITNIIPQLLHHDLKITNFTIQRKEILQRLSIIQWFFSVRSA